MRPVRRHGQLLPLLHVLRRDRLRSFRFPQLQQTDTIKRATHAVVRGLRVVPVELRDLRHGPDADDALDREVRLVHQGAREPVRAELLRGLQRLRDQETCPLVK